VTSGQEMERVYSYNPRARTGLTFIETVIFDVNVFEYVLSILLLLCILMCML